MTHPVETMERAKALRKTGMTARAIALELGVPKSSVEGWLSGRARPRPPRPRFNERAPVCIHASDTVAQARALHRAGMHGRAVAARLAVPFPTVDDWLRLRTRPPITE